MTPTETMEPPFLESAITGIRPHAYSTQVLNKTTTTHVLLRINADETPSFTSACRPRPLPRLRFWCKNKSVFPSLAPLLTVRSSSPSVPRAWLCY